MCIHVININFLISLLSLASFSYYIIRCMTFIHKHPHPHHHWTAEEEEMTEILKWLQVMHSFSFSQVTNENTFLVAKFKYNRMKMIKERWSLRKCLKSQSLIFISLSLLMPYFLQEIFLTFIFDSFDTYLVTKMLTHILSCLKVTNQTVGLHLISNKQFNNKDFKRY